MTNRSLSGLDGSANGRNKNGTFATGHPGGPGRPRRAVEEQYLLAISDACPLDKWKQIVDSGGQGCLERGLLCAGLAGEVPCWKTARPALG